MPLTEQTGFRSMAYSEWHRPDSIKLLGYISKKDLLRFGRMENGQFLEIDHKYLDPIGRLIELLKTIKYPLQEKGKS